MGSQPPPAPVAALEDFRAALPELEIPAALADALADYEELRTAPE